MPKAVAQPTILEQIVVHEDSAEPIYFQIKEQLKQLIAEGILKSGDLLPSDTELSTHLGVSRMTVRQAMQELVYMGVAKRKRGRGTFVTTPKITQPLLQVTSFTKSMTEMGYRPTSAVLSLKAVDPAQEVKDALELTPDQQVIELKRLRCIDGLPISIQTSYLPLPAAEGLLHNKEKLANYSLYELLKEYCNLLPSRTVESLEIHRVEQDEAELLEIALGDPVFFVEAVVTSSKGEPMEFVYAQYRGDLFKFQIETAVPQ